MIRRPLICLGCLFLFPIALSAGVYSKIDSQSLGHDPFIIVHPYGYTGVGGSLVLKLCAASSTVEHPLQQAIDLWNQLEAMTGNCPNCLQTEDPVPPESPFHLRSLLTHELGHCAMGLGHPNWAGTSFTNIRDATSVGAGADSIRGSRDDVPVPLPGARLIHWFRLADNNPVVVDAVAIESTTFSRRITDLPSGHNWAASANRAVASSLGAAETHSALYSDFHTTTFFKGLAADEVNTVKFAMTGIDSLAGTSDDYTITLLAEPNCALADIEVHFFSPDPNDPAELATLGRCLSSIEQIDAGNTAHYKITVGAGLGPRLEIEINDTINFDTVFGTGFESGNLNDWDAFLP
jgi:hypothetical protein